MAIVTLTEAKKYLRVDNDDDDTLILSLIQTGELLCEDIMRQPLAHFDPLPEIIRLAILYSVAQTYEFRENLDASVLEDNLRRLLFAYRREVW